MVDPYINTTGTNLFDPQTSEFDRTLSPSGTSYVLCMPARPNRKGYEFEGAVANTGTFSIRYGATGPIYEVVGGGSHARGVGSPDGVYKGDIWVKTSVGGEKIIAQEW